MVDRPQVITSRGDRELLKKQFEAAIRPLREQVVEKSDSDGYALLMGRVVELSQMLRLSPSEALKRRSRPRFNGHDARKLHGMLVRWNNTLAFLPFSLDRCWEDFLTLVRVLHAPEEHPEGSRELLLESLATQSKSFGSARSADEWLRRAQAYRREVLPFWLRVTGDTEALPEI